MRKTRKTRNLSFAAIVVVVGALMSTQAADARNYHKHKQPVAPWQVGQAPAGLQSANGFWMSTFGPCEDLNVVTVMWCDRKALNGRR